MWGWNCFPFLSIWVLLGLFFFFFFFNVCGWLFVFWFVFFVGHCIIYSSSIYDFWFPLWYFQTFHKEKTKFERFLIKIKRYKTTQTPTLNVSDKLFAWWALTPLSTIFQLYRDVSFIGGWNQRTRRKPPTCRKSLTNFIT